MRTLILSANTGEGHNSCSKAIKEVYDAHNEYCVIEDGLAFAGKPVSKFISGGHTMLYRYMPWVLNSGYGAMAKGKSTEKDVSKVIKLFKAAGKKLNKYIIDNKIDNVICAHVMPGLLMSSVLKWYSPDVKTSLLATDYSCSVGFKSCILDRYFIPTEDLKDIFRTDYIDDERLVASGIPIKSGFYTGIGMKEAKEKLRLPPDHKHLLMAFGSMGAGKMDHIIEGLAEKLPDDIEMTVICGTNSRKRKKLKLEYFGRPNIHIRGYIKRMPLMLDSADLYLTKSGGLSTSEAAAKRLPMVLIDTIKAFESGNRDYFTSLGSALVAENHEDIPQLCIDILRSDEKLSAMRAAYGKMKIINAAECIFDTMRSLNE